MSTLFSGQLDLASGWAAGVLNAEGVARVHKGSIETRVRAVDCELLDRLAAVLGGYVKPYTNGFPARAPIFEWKLPSAEARSVLPRLLPLLAGALRRSVEEALASDWALRERMTRGAR
jgi:hypothetical protein